MSRILRRTRELLIALSVLALTAAIALAARPASAPPAAAADGLERAAEMSGKTVPVSAVEEEAPATDEDEDAAENEPLPVDEEAGEHPDNHGATVSEAAKGETPEGFDNHGQYVRSIATDNHGHDEDAERGSKKAKP